MHNIHPRTSQSGIVSIMVTMIMMIVISLIVLGFAQVSRTEQRNSLDDQLSTQAYYAAESGINDAIAAINANLKNGDTDLDKLDQCQGHTNYSSDAFDYNDMSNGSKVSYTCLLINSAPPQVVYQVSYDPTVTLLDAGQNNRFKSLHLSWQAATQPDGQPAAAANSSQCLATPGHFPPTGSYSAGCPYPILRIDLVPIGNTISRNGLQQDTMTAFLEPLNKSVAGDGTLSFNGDQSKKLTTTYCTATCDVNLTGLNSQRYYLRVSTLYQTNSRLTIKGTDQAGRAASFHGSQATIDVTGKAQDVLRRVKVAVDLTNTNGNISAMAPIMTQDSVCKQYAVAIGGYMVGPPGGSIAGGADNPLCNTANQHPPTGDISGSGKIGSKSGKPNPNPLPQPGPHWSVNYYINEAPKEKDVAYCVWDWDDGTVTGPLYGNACQPGNQSKAGHTYPNIGDVCRDYKIVVHFHMIDGSIVDSNTINAWITWSSDSKFKCPHP